jgi:type I restriction enzyme M protein
MTDLQDFSRRLFAAANQLWTNTALRPDQYGQPVLALIALRQMEAKFQSVHAELAPRYKGRLKPKPSDYQARGAIFLPEKARFSPASLAARRGEPRRRVERRDEGYC